LCFILEKAVHHREGAMFAKESKKNKSSMITLWVDRFSCQQIGFLCVPGVFAMQMPFVGLWI
jgi:hypothetical protein